MENNYLEYIERITDEKRLFSEKDSLNQSYISIPEHRDEFLEKLEIVGNRIMAILEKSVSV